MSFVSKKDVLSKRVLLAVVAAGFLGVFQFILVLWLNIAATYQMES